MKYNRLWNNSLQILEQVIEGIPLFSPCNFKVVTVTDDSYKHLNTSWDVTEVTIHSGIEGREVLSQHLPNTSPTPPNCTPKVGHK